jgi:hypothetical protein
MTRTTPFYRSFIFCLKMRPADLLPTPDPCPVPVKASERSGALVKVRAKFADRSKPHHALGHLRLDRTVGIQRIGHSVDHAGFEDRHLRPVIGPRWRAGIERRWPAGAAPVRVGSERLRRRPGVFEGRGWPGLWRRNGLLHGCGRHGQIEIARGRVRRPCPCPFPPRRR